MPYKDIAKQREAQRRSYLRNRDQHNFDANANRVKRRIALNEYVQAIKEASPCCDCGINYPYYVMDFDHVRGEKIGGISTMIHEAVRQEILNDEIAKCDLVCSNCHRQRTFTRP